MADPSQTPVPGWYPDPSNGEGYRGWDGQQWGQVAPPPPPTEEQQRAEADSPARAMVAGGGAAVVLGSFLPWASVSSPFGTVTVSGMEGDGILTLILAVVLLVVAWPLVAGSRLSRGRAIATGLLGAVGGLLGFFAIANVSDAVADGEFVIGQVGVGLWAVAAGSVVVVAGAIKAANDAA